MSNIELHRGDLVRINERPGYLAIVMRVNVPALVPSAELFVANGLVTIQPVSDLIQCPLHLTAEATANFAEILDPFKLVDRQNFTA